MKRTKENTRRSKEFENLVLEHLDMLYGVALRLTRNPTDAQDLTQNTVVKALRFHDRFQEGTYIKAWLLTILRNTFINEYRRKARRPQFVELDGSESGTDQVAEREGQFGPPPSTANEMLELVDDEVRLAVESLPDDFRQAVVMADLQDMSYKEIAEAMDCPLGTVMSRLYRGRRMMREQLHAYAKDRGLAGGKKRR